MNNNYNIFYNYFGKSSLNFKIDILVICIILEQHNNISKMCNFSKMLTYNTYYMLSSPLYPRLL